jgi:hypothetical protein
MGVKKELVKSRFDRLSVTNQYCQSELVED